MTLVRYDLHLHTFRSGDSLTSYEAIIRRVQERGLTGIAVTDHNTLRGAIELAKIAPFPVILAEEIRTCEGEIIGYFLQEEIPRGLGLEESIRRVHDQGGVVSVPHPVDSVRRRSALGETVLRRVIDQIEMIEGQNGRAVLPADNLRARQLATEFGKPMTAGSDAHAPFEIGRCSVELEAFTTPQEFVANLKQAQISGADGRPYLSLFSLFAKIAKRAGFRA
jgi:predicted metal-dependent phosphoesterase TrpH